MNKVWHIAVKELLQTRRDRLAAVFTIIAPVIFTIFLGVLIGEAQDESRRLPLAVAVTQRSAATQALVDRLRISPFLEIKEMAPLEIEAAVQDQEVAAALLIPAGYEAALREGRQVSLTLVRTDVSTGAQSVSEAVNAAIDEVNSRLLASRIAAEQVAAVAEEPVTVELLAEAEKEVAAALAEPALTLTVVDAGAASTRPAGGFDQASPGSLVNWVLFSLLTVAGGLSWERHQGLLRRLSVAGLSRRHVVGGKALAMVVLSFSQQLFLILLGQLAFGVDYFRSPLALLFTMVSLSVLAASVGLMISSLFRSEQAIIAGTIISAQVLAAFGGAWFPLELTSKTFFTAAHVLPSAWVLDSFHGIIMRGWTVADVLGPLGLVWAWAVALFAIAVWRLRLD